MSMLDLPIDVREQIARRTLIIVVPVVLVATLVIVLSGILLAPDRPKYAAFPPIAGAVIAAWLAYRGKALVGAAVLLSGLAVAASIGMWLNGGVMAPVYLVCLPMAVMVATLYGHLWTIVFVSLVALHGSFFLYAQAAGWVGPTPEFKPILKWIVVSVFSGLSATFALVPLDLLRRTTRSLERSNEDLQQFAYVAAHDLQEPTRMIQLYLQLIEHGLAGKIDAQAQAHLAFVIASARRMQNLVSAVLEFSSIGRDQAGFALVNTRAAAEQALSNLAGQIQLSGAQIAIRPLPQIVAHETHLVRLFQNLVANAIKYRSHHEPKIEIWAEQSGAESIFSVSDNGIGIEAEYGGKLFGLFQRLHSRDQYPGEGIGLASCRKIVSLHDGRIWFEPREGGGTIFRFSIPVRSAVESATARSGVR